MKKMMNRTLAILLASVMMISNVGMSVSAEELTKVQTYEQEGGQALPGQEMETEPVKQNTPDTTEQKTDEETAPETSDNAQDSDKKQDDAGTTGENTPENAAEAGETGSENAAGTDDTKEEILEEDLDGVQGNEPEEVIDEAAAEESEQAEEDEFEGEELAFEEILFEDVYQENAAAKIVAAESFHGGAGTEKDPYQISTAEELMLFYNKLKESTSDYPDCFKLVNDIDLQWETWELPIRTEENRAFAGTFDGNGKTISNITKSGAFIFINKGTIKDLTIKNLKPSEERKLSGGGFVEKNYGTISGCTLSGSDIVLNGTTVFAGICYRTFGGKIIKCTNEVNIKYIPDGTEGSSGVITGIVELVESIKNDDGKCIGATISDCHNKGNLIGAGNVAGIVESAADPNVNPSADALPEYIIENCSNTGNLSGHWVTGICLGSSVSGNIRVEDCVNTGKIVGDEYASGIVGNGSGIIIRGCTNSGEIIVNGYKDTVGDFQGGIAGGIAGSYYVNTLSFSDGSRKTIYNLIENCCNTGRISGTIEYFCGGIVGVLQGGTIRSCFNSGSIDVISAVQEATTMLIVPAVGGIAGQIRNGYSDVAHIPTSSEVTFIEDCFNAGSIAWHDSCKEKKSFTLAGGGGLGGICGDFADVILAPNSNAEQFPVKRCYNVGRIVGDTTKKRDKSYDITPNDRVAGGLLGIGGMFYSPEGKREFPDGQKLWADCYYINSAKAAVGCSTYFWPQNVNPESGAERCTASGMQTAGTFKGFDFDSVWKMGEGDYKYPVLRAINVNPVVSNAEITEEEPDSYTVTFDAMNGTDPDERTVPCGAKIECPKDPERLGYTFAGWYTEDSLVNRWDFENGCVWDHITLYAGWEAFDALNNLPAAEDIADGVAETFWMAKLGSYTYTGAAIKPTVQVYAGTRRLKAGTDYTVTYKNNAKAGTASVTVKGKGSYKKCTALTTTFTILPRDLGGYLVSKTFTNAYAVTKNKTNPKLALTLKYGKKTLKKNTDYSLKVCDKDGNGEVSDWRAPGTYSIKVEGNGNYKGTYSAKFLVVDGTPVSKLSVSKIKAQQYNGGEAIKPALTIKKGKTVLEEGVDYSLSYRNNTEIGTATVVIIGRGDYFGTRRVTFAIAGISMKKVKFAGFVSTMEYNGTKQTQNASLTYQGAALEVGKDYTIVAYENNRDAGKAAVIYKGMGNYSGTVKKTYKIKAKNLNAFNPETDVTLSGPLYPGGMPAVTIYDTARGTNLDPAIDYKVSYPNTTKQAAGDTAKLTITGKGNYTGKIYKTYTLTAAAGN